MSKRIPIETISIREIPEGVVPFKYVVEEIQETDSKCTYTSLRDACQSAGITFYKFADMVLCVERVKAIDAFKNRNKAGRPWHKEKKQ